MAAPSLRIYTEAAVRAATGDFAPANGLGAGSFGEVFRGVLDGQLVAIKRLGPGHGLDVLRDVQMYAHVPARENVMPILGMVCFSCPLRRFRRLGPHAA
jgi:hypothetical protein